MRTLNKGTKTDNMAKSNTESDTEDDNNAASGGKDVGMKKGGFCNFTKCLPVVYLRMWLNEIPRQDRFVARKMRNNMQRDSLGGGAGVAQGTCVSNANENGSKKWKTLLLLLLVRRYLTLLQIGNQKEKVNKQLQNLCTEHWMPF